MIHYGAFSCLQLKWRGLAKLVADIDIGFTFAAQLNQEKIYSIKALQIIAIYLFIFLAGTRVVPDTDYRGRIWMPDNLVSMVTEKPDLDIRFLRKQRFYQLDIRVRFLINGSSCIQTGPQNRYPV